MATKKEQSQASDTPSAPYKTATFREGDVETAASAKDTDTFHRMVVLEDNPFGADPANQAVIVGEDVIEDFQYPRTTRPARRLVAAAGTMTTRRLAEESGISSVQEWSPEGDEADNPRPQFSTPVSTAEAERANSGDAADDDAYGHTGPGSGTGPRSATGSAKGSGKPEAAKAETSKAQGSKAEGSK